MRLRLLSADLARRVARELMAKGALAALARDELGLTEALAARTGGAPVMRGAARVAFWAALSMAATMTTAIGGSSGAGIG